MTRIVVQGQALELLDLDGICRAAGVSSEWLRQRADAGLLPPGVASAGSLHALRLDAGVLQHLRCMWRIERDFDAAPELAALVADLESEIDRLRALLGAR
jgi:chaperone modulatory protein CbpM